MLNYHRIYTTLDSSPKILVFGRLGRWAVRDQIGRRCRRFAFWKPPCKQDPGQFPVVLEEHLSAIENP